MKPYPDTNFLVRVYLPLDEEDEALGRLIQSSAARRSGPIPVTTLSRFEVRNALQRTLFEHRKGGRGRVTVEGAIVAQGDFDDDLKSGILFKPAHLALEDIEAQFESLVARHTAKEGFRTYDILHVASALHLGCDTFWSFDAKALRLAKREGLKTNR